MISQNLDDLVVQIKQHAGAPPSLMVYHSTKAENFQSIFEDNQPHVGTSFPTYFFYGKPSFFCQFSKNLNRMAIALPGLKCDVKEICLHDSGINIWPMDYKNIFNSYFGDNILSFQGDFSLAKKAAAFIFGGNERYFEGMKAEPLIKSKFLENFSKYISELSVNKSGQTEKARTIELKSTPVRADSESVVFLVEPNLKRSITIGQDDGAVTELSSERDSAISLMEAAKAAHLKQLKIVSCLDQRPSPFLVESVYIQLFAMVRKHSLAQLVA